MAFVFNDRLVETIGERVMIRTNDDLTYRLIRVSDGMMLQRIGALPDARARAQALIDGGHA